MRDFLNVLLLLLFSLPLRAVESAGDVTLDPFESEQWSLRNVGLSQYAEVDFLVPYVVPGRVGEDIRMPLRRLAQTSDRKIRVAVLDTGVELNHPDLKGQMVRHEDECRALEKLRSCLQSEGRESCEKRWYDLKNPEVDLDGNGYPLDCSGWTFVGEVNQGGVRGYPELFSDAGHGTHVAGLIGASVGNGQGIRGVAEDIEILPVQVLLEQPSNPIKPVSLKPGPAYLEDQLPSVQGLADVVARGIIYAIRSRADVINISLVWPPAADTELLEKAVAEAQSRGIIIVAAAGNDATRSHVSPCYLAGVICVAALGPEGGLAYFSNHGPEIDIAAPGIHMLSTWPLSQRSRRFQKEAGYEYLSGTSQAAPLVAGAAAELLRRGIPANEVRARLLASALPLKESNQPHSIYEAPTHLIQNDLSQRRIVMSGQLNLQGALSESPRPYFVLANRKPKELTWDRKATRFESVIEVENIWQSVEAAKISIAAEVKESHDESMALRPVPSDLKYSKMGIWRQGEKRQVKVILDIPPDQRPLVSEFDVSLRFSGQPLRRPQELSQAHVIAVPVQVESIVQGMDKFEVRGLERPPSGLLKVEDLSDERSNQVYYWASEFKDKSWTYRLLGLSSDRRAYEVMAEVELPAPSRPQIAKQVFHYRVDWSGDQVPDWVLGVYEQRSLGADQDDQKPSELTLYLLRHDFALADEIKIKADRIAIPRTLVWMALGDRYVPAWVSLGRDPNKRPSLVDEWINPDGFEEPLRRLYYVDLEGEVRYLEGSDGWMFVSVLPQNKQSQSTSLRVLMAKNRGGKLRPSYESDFAVAEVNQGKIDSQVVINGGLGQAILRQVEGDVLSLDGDGPVVNGTYWFGASQPRTQDVSWIGLDSMRGLESFRLQAERGVVDGVLWVRALFAGRAQKSAFALTNSEIQFHDFVQHKTLTKSLKRYTFLEDKWTKSMIYPGVLKGQRGELSPMVYFADSERHQLSFRPVVPAYDRQGRVGELITPARLRFVMSGCVPIHDALAAKAVADSTLQPPMMDFFCYTHILRVPLSL